MEGARSERAFCIQTTHQTPQAPTRLPAPLRPRLPPLPAQAHTPRGAGQRARGAGEGRGEAGISKQERKGHLQSPGVRVRPGRRVRAAPPQADLSPGTGGRRGPGTGCGCSARPLPGSRCLGQRRAPSGAPPAPAARPAPSPCPVRPRAGRRARPVPEPRAGAAATAAPKLPPSLLLLCHPAEPGRAPRPPYLRACAGSGAAGGSWSRAKATASPAESPDRCAPSPPAPHFLSRPLGLEIPGEARCSPGSSQSPRAGPAQPLSAQAAAGGRACPGRWPRLHLMLLSPPSRGHGSGKGAPLRRRRRGLGSGDGASRFGRGWCRRSRGGSAGGRAGCGHRGKEGRGDGSGRAGSARRRAARFPCLPRGRCSSSAQTGASNTIAFIKQRKCHWEEREGGRAAVGRGRRSGSDQDGAASRSSSPRQPPAGGASPESRRGWGCSLPGVPGLREAPASPPQAPGKGGGAGSP